MANKTVYPYGTGGSLPSSIGIINDLKTGGADNALAAEQGKVIGNILGTPDVFGLPFSGLTHFKDGYQLKANSSQIGKVLADVDTYQGSNYVNVKIPISGYSRMKFRHYASYSEYGSLIVDANNIVLAVAVNNSGTYYDMYVDIPSNAAYFVYSYNAGTYSKDVTLYKADGVLQRLDSLELSEQDTQNPTVTGGSPKLTAGRLDSSGAKVSGNYLTTETIFGDFYIHVADGWKLYEAHLYDRDGKMISYRYYNPNTPTPINRWSASFALQDYGNANTVPEYGIRLVVCKTDSSAIAEGENPVEYFVTMATSGLHRWVPDDLPNYGRALRRLDYLEHLRWVPLAKVFDGSSATTDDYYFNAGNVVVGLSYSDVAETRKYVPNNVSIRTLLTAAKNRRSLLYTEDLANNVSKYGMTYKSGYRKCYYGTVCSGLTAWVMGLDTLYLSGAYGNNTIPGLSSVSSPNANNVKPLDLVWCDGHITIISDIYKDDFGAVAFVVLAEMSSPYPHRTIYTPEQFEARLLRNGGYTVHRWSGWENLAEPEASEYTQYLLGQTKKEPEWGGDIMCFAGDYAAFAEGDIIHLNARRKSTYTGVELYKDDVLLQTIDITGLSADTIVTPNTEDWVDVNLTTLNLTYGKYKARLTDGTNTTDYTYFEVIDITFTASKSGSTVTAYFSSNEGVPVSLERVQENGFADAYKQLTAEMVEAGQATAWGTSSGHPNLILLVKGDYGTVTKTIPIPS